MTEKEKLSANYNNFRDAKRGGKCWVLSFIMILIDETYFKLYTCENNFPIMSVSKDKRKRAVPVKNNGKNWIMLFILYPIKSRYNGLNFKEKYFTS